MHYKNHGIVLGSRGPKWDDESIASILYQPLFMFFKEALSENNLLYIKLICGIRLSVYDSEETY